MDGMDPSDRRIPERVHAILRAEAPEPTPRIGYGGPAHARVEGEVVCVFRGAWKFKTRYATLGFGDAARLDEGNLWATDFALREIPPAEEARIVALVRKATRPIGRPASSSKPG